MKRKGKAKLLLALFFIAVPNINILDLLPDYISYIILYRFINSTALAVPYMHETKRTLGRLIILNFAKLPAFVVMIANMHTGRDIVPLCTLAFGVIEAILLYSLVADLFHGLFYIAERSNSGSITAPLELKSMTITAEGVRMLSFFFLMVKCFLNVVPEFCLLTTFNPKIIRLTNGLYGPLLIFAFLISLALGVIWFNVSRQYIKRIYKETDLNHEIESILGDDKIEKIKNDRMIDKLVFPISMLMISSLFTIDFTFANTNGINLLPHCIYGFFLFMAGIRIAKRNIERWITSALSLLYVGFGMAAYVYTIIFSKRYRIVDLPTDTAAMDHYKMIELFTLLETVFFLALAGFILYMLFAFIKERTGVSPRKKTYNRVERDYHRMSMIKVSILFGVASLIQIAKCVKVYLEATVNLIFSEGKGVIVTSPLPWFNWSIIAVSVVFIFFSFIFYSDIKADIRFKYDKEEIETRKGAFE